MTSFALVLSLATLAADPAPTVRIGSKTFTESVILGEMAARLIRETGTPVLHRRELGGTQVLFHGLESGEIDAYPEYTGTIAGEILSGKGIKDEASMRAALAERGVGMSRSLGFNDGYAIGMREDVADAAGHPRLQRPQEASRPEIRIQQRVHGARRRLARPPRPLRPPPARRPRARPRARLSRLAADEIQATDLYSTDAEVRAKGLRVLRDDLQYFPPYLCVWLYRADLPNRAPAAFAALGRLEGRIDASEMAAMNARAKFDHVPEDRIAGDFLQQSLGLTPEVTSEGFVARLLRRLGEHLALVSISLAAAIAVAVPLGILAARLPRLGSFILATTGVIQTIPSLALLVFMIPWLGIGAKPALVALFLYSLLPIVRNTATGLRDIPPSLRESAEALGLPPVARLRLVELPLASRAILAGIKTAAVINVGTATIGALIGAGGFGQPILTGIRRDDVAMILYEGAIPAAVLALAVQGAFDVAERWLVPRGLRV